MYIAARDIPFGKFGYPVIEADSHQLLQHVTLTSILMHSMAAHTVTFRRCCPVTEADSQLLQHIALMSISMAAHAVMFRKCCYLVTEVDSHQLSQHVPLMSISMCHVAAHAVTFCKCFYLVTEVDSHQL